MIASGVFPFPSSVVPMFLKMKTNKQTDTHTIGILFLIPFLIHPRTQHPFYCKGQRSYNFFNFLNAHSCYINFHYYSFFLGLIFRAFQIIYAPYSHLQIKQ